MPILTQIPGPKSKAIREREDKYLAPGLQQFALQAGIVVEKAQGSRLWDVDGNEFIDIIGGIGVNGLGHSHPGFIKAIQEQVAKASVGSFTSEPRVEFMERLGKYHPVPHEYRLQLYSSGAEAVESALRLAKSYTGKNEFVSFWGGFHGKTQGALSLMGSSFKHSFGPMVPGNTTVPYANCYRCPANKTKDSCHFDCIQMAREQIKMNLTGNVAAIIVEPFQGTAGNLLPPKEFLPAMAELAKELGALLIADEMITGFGRTGKFWGVSHTGVIPDIITMGKQFGGGFPLSAVLAKDEVSQAKPWANPSGSSSSYGGNPLAAAAANASLKIIEEENLVENSNVMGEYFLSKLKVLEKYSFIGDIRGLGLLIGIDFVKDKQSRELLPRHVTQQIFDRCLQKGLLTMAYAPQFRIQPSMNIDKETIDEAVSILDSVCEQFEKDRVWETA